MLPRRLALLFLLICLPLAAAQASTDKEIRSLQKNLVELAGKLRSGENKLADLAIRQNRLDAKIADAKIELESKRDEIDALLQSLLRLSRTPPEAIVAMPGELKQTIQAAQLMTHLTQQMQEKTATLTKTLKTLHQDELDLAETREKLKQQQHKLLASQKALEEKLKQRQAIYEGESRDFSAKIKAAGEAKKTSKDVSQLVTRLEEKKIALAEPPARSQPEKKTTSRSFTSYKGSLRLPVAGQIIRRFGQKDGMDQTSHGLRVASAEGATVISPVAGEVMFTGPFLDYGNIVIVKYDNGYHLLLAGLGKINCSVGQKIANGEPLGRIGSKADLYLELRRNGKAIDPAPWFG